MYSPGQKNIVLADESNVNEENIDAKIEEAKARLQNLLVCHELWKRSISFLIFLRD